MFNIPVSVCVSSVSSKDSLSILKKCYKSLISSMSWFLIKLPELKFQDFSWRLYELD